MRYVPPGYLPMGFWPQGFLPGGLDVGGYCAYLGPVLADGSYVIDYETPVGYSPPGATQMVISGAALADGVWAVGLRCTSSAGVEETNTDRVAIVEIVDGVLQHPRPNKVVSAAASAAAGGKMRVSGYYSARFAAGKAVGCQVALVTGGVPDWESLLATIAVAGTGPFAQVLDETFCDGEVVRLAVRMVSDLGAVSPALRLTPVAADAVGPPSVDYVTAEQVS